MALTRSEKMSLIRGANTKPELVLKDALECVGWAPEQHVRVLRTRPDLLLEPERVAIFIDGCFWHGCPEHYVRPRTRAEFWATKLRENVERDGRQVAVLEAEGWRVVRVWEHSVFESLEDVVALVGNVVAGVTVTGDERRVIRVDELDDPWQERRVLVELRDPVTVVDEHVGRRITKKWRRPRKGARRPQG